MLLLLSLVLFDIYIVIVIFVNFIMIVIFIIIFFQDYISFSQCIQETCTCGISSIIVVVLKVVLKDYNYYRTYSACASFLNALKKRNINNINVNNTNDNNNNINKPIFEELMTTLVKTSEQLGEIWNNNNFLGLEVPRTLLLFIGCN